LYDDSAIFNQSPDRTPTGNHPTAGAAVSGHSGAASSDSGKPFFSSNALGPKASGSGLNIVTHFDGKSATGSSSHSHHHDNNNNNSEGTKTSWYQELVGCFGPVLSFMGKEKQSQQNAARGKKNFFLVPKHLSGSPFPKL
jgi:hypothetical protein